MLGFLSSVSVPLALILSSYNKEHNYVYSGSQKAEAALVGDGCQDREGLAFFS